MFAYFGFITFVIGITFSGINWSTTSDLVNEAAKTRSGNVKTYNTAVNNWKSGSYYNDLNNAQAGTFQITSTSSVLVLQKNPSPADENKDVKLDDYASYSNKLVYTGLFSVPTNLAGQNVQFRTGTNSYTITMAPVTNSAAYPSYRTELPSEITRSGRLYDCKVSDDACDLNFIFDDDIAKCKSQPLCEDKCRDILGIWDGYDETCTATAYLKSMCFRLEKGSGATNWRLKGQPSGTIFIDSSDLNSKNAGCYYGSKDEFLGIDEYYPGIYEYVPAQFSRATVTVEFRHDKDPFLVLDGLSEGSLSLTGTPIDGFQLWVTDYGGSIPLILSVTFFIICCVIIAKQPPLPPPATINPETVPNAPPAETADPNIIMKPIIVMPAPLAPPPAYDPTYVRVQMPVPQIINSGVYSADQTAQQAIFPTSPPSYGQ